MVIMWKDKRKVLHAENIANAEIDSLEIEDQPEDIKVLVRVVQSSAWDTRNREVGSFRTMEAAEYALREIALDVANGEDDVFIELWEDGVKLVQHKQPVNGAGWQYCSYTEGGCE